MPRIYVNFGRSNEMIVFGERVNQVAAVDLFREVFGFDAYSLASTSYLDNYTYLSTRGRNTGVLTSYNGTIEFTFRNLGEGSALEKLRTLYEAIKAKLCKEPPEGYIKSYLFSRSDNFWRVRKPSSSKTVQLGNKYLEANCGEFIKVYTAADKSTFEWALPGTRTDVWNVRDDESGSTAYLRSVLTPIYAVNPEQDGPMLIGSRLSEDYVQTYILPQNAENMYEHVVRGGKKIFYAKQRPEYAYFAKPIMCYSTRIENVVPTAHLFQKGSKDLYKNRPQEITPFLGWELEACGDSAVANVMKNMMKFDVICKSDSSIQPSGFETVSVPATLDYWKESNLSSMLDTARSAPHNMRSFKHSSCGFHVHVSRAALTVLDLNKIERFVHNPANLEFMKSIAGRGPNTYQHYYPDMFEKRKELDRSKRSSASIFGATTDYTSHDRTRIQDYIAQHDGDKVKAVVSYCWDYISIGSGPEWDACYRAILDRGSYDEALAVLKLAPSSEVYPSAFERIRNLIQHVFPDAVTESPQSSAEYNGKYKDFKALCKSSAPHRRKDSHAASQRVKGPVGKAAKGRYDVLNTKNENTVEFRLFKGTMNPDSVFRYLEFVDAIVRYVHEAGASNNALDQKEFCKWLVGDGFNIARYEKLVAYLVAKEFIDRKSIRRRELEYKFEQADNG